MNPRWYGGLFLLLTACVSGVAPAPTYDPSPTPDPEWFLTDACQPPPGITVDGTIAANVFAWRDQNGNGVREEGDTPLPWVAVGRGDDLVLTNENGLAQWARTQPGCACNCWRGQSVSIHVPAGYIASTPKEQPLTGEAVIYEFGFREMPGFEQPDFPGEPAWALAFAHQGLVVEAFDERDGALTLAVNTQAQPDRAIFLETFFLIVRALDAQGIRIDRVELTLRPAEETIRCDMDTVYEAWGAVSFLDMAAQHCQTGEANP